MNFKRKVIVNSVIFSEDFDGFCQKTYKTKTRSVYAQEDRKKEKQKDQQRKEQRKAKRQPV